MQCFPWNQSKSGPDPKFMEHFKIRIQSKINEIRHSPDPVQSKSSSMLISVAHLCCVSDPWPPLVSCIWLLFLPSHGCYAVMWHCFVFRVLQLRLLLLPGASGTKLGSGCSWLIRDVWHTVTQWQCTCNEIIKNKAVALLCWLPIQKLCHEICSKFERMYCRIIYNK